ncbi:hypothetical protein QR77_12380 [Streptomyces sp. 150FB]|nr:hypothetical protein QR77_12380 [Streptomyces sp. 150FB]
MSGQRKRRQRQDQGRRATGSPAFEVGRWEVLFETQEESEYRAHLRGLRAAGGQIDWAMTRIDMLCGRLSQPTTYRLSLFVPDPEDGPGRSGPDS